MKQEGIPLAGFSACGGSLWRHDSLSPQCDPRGAFFISWDVLSYEIKKQRDFYCIFRAIKVSLFHYGTDEFLHRD